MTKSAPHDNIHIIFFYTSFIAHLIMIVHTLACNALLKVVSLMRGTLTATGTDMIPVNI